VAQQTAQSQNVTEAHALSVLEWQGAQAEQPLDTWGSLPFAPLAHHTWLAQYDLDLELQCISIVALSSCTD